MRPSLTACTRHAGEAGIVLAASVGLSTCVSVCVSVRANVTSLARYWSAFENQAPSGRVPVTADQDDYDDSHYDMIVTTTSRQKTLTSACNRPNNFKFFCF